MESSLACPAFDQSPPSDAEKERIRDLSRYYGAFRHQPTPTNDPQSTHSDYEEKKEPEEPALSRDIVLTALVQLGVYRFGCNRAFVSLIDGQNQHIISEATASVSLRDNTKHLPDDGIYLGVTTLDLAFGVCPHAVKLFTGQDVPQLRNSANMTATSTRFIVRDFTLEEGFKEKPYVLGWPYFRFYAEVPVYSPAGYVLGSFCVVDDKPRQSFGEADIIALQEISDSISNHLENVRTVHYHARSDRLVQGLTNFVKGRPAIKPPASVEAQQKATPLARLPSFISRLSSDVPLHDTLGIEQLSLASTATDETSPFASGQESSIVTMSTSVSTPLQDNASSQPAIENLIKEKPVRPSVMGEHDLTRTNSLGTPLVAVKEGVPVSKRFEAIFSHASSLLRESMDLEGVLFLDACHCNFGIGHSADSSDWEPFPTTVDNVFTSNTTPGIRPQHYKDTSCKVLGFASSENVEGGATKVNLPICSLTESFLHQLVSRYPDGQIFDLDGVQPSQEELPDAEYEKSSRIRTFWGGQGLPSNDEVLSQAIAARLADYFPNARSVVFLPLWDWNEGHWLAGTFIWTHDSDRPLELDELHYFKVFGDTIVSEIARVESFELEKSKSDFISSVSHELRSPLHGMLASAELLLGTPLQAEQLDLVKMLETCGLTLLDTMNHLLDFTKINNLTSIEEDKNGFNDTTTNLASVFDLDVLVEEVISTLYVGKFHAGSVSHSLGFAADMYMPMKTKDKGKLSVVLRIADQNCWKMQSVSGAWRRIIMNIFGNALKYTQSGFIEVSLCKVKQESEASNDYAHLSITDTGCGMSPEFLRNKLFSPFAQEDALSEGVGLGMSIVQQLVGLMKGIIDVKSEPEVGTQVDIYIPIQAVPVSPTLSASPAPSLNSPGLNETKFCLVGFQGYPDLTEVPTGSLGREAKRKLCLQSYLAHIITQQPGWSVSFAETLDNASGDVAIMEETMLEQMLEQESPQPLDGNKSARLLVLGVGGPSPAVLQLTKLRSDVVHTVSPPFRPQKMLEALHMTSKTISAPPLSSIHNAALIQNVSLSEPSAETAEAAVAEGSSEVSATSSDLKLRTRSLTVNSLHSRRPSFNKNNEALHVLIVDDNNINLKVLSTFIRKLGHTFDTATDGLIALNKYKANPLSFNLVLMDISMPVMDGIVATSKMRAFEKQQALDPVTILAVTGVASATMQQQALSAGIDNYLIKPLTLQQLKRVIVRST